MKKIPIVKLIFLIPVCAVGLLSCNKDSDDDKQPGIDDATINEYLEQNSISAVKDTSGIYYEKLTENTSGKGVEAGMVVAMRYKISKLDGTVLEDLITKDSAVLLRQGTGNVLPAGLDYGLRLMKTHEKYRFYIPAYRAYDDYSNADFFPSNTNFIVEAIVDSVFSTTDRFATEEDSIESYIARNSIATEKFASGLFYSAVTVGTGDSPLTGYHVKFNFTRKSLSGKVLYTTTSGNPAILVLGTGAAVEGLEEGLKQMRKGGKSILLMSSKLAFGASVRVLPSGMMNDLYEEGYLLTNVAPYEPLIYEVELLDVY